MKKLLTSVCLCALPAMATGQDVGTGQMLFDNYCATCHGVDGRGLGPMSQILLIQPSDLTQLTAKADGTFPISGIIAKIDGRDPLLSHGSPMPTFGGFFEGRGETIRGEEGILIMTSQPIIDLVTYLETIQDAH